MARTPKITKADKQDELAAAMKSKTPAGKQTKKAKVARVMFAAPAPSKVKALFIEWRAGGVSLWTLKKKHHVKASHMLPVFKKMANAAEAKVLAKGPAARMPKPGASKVERLAQAVAPKAKKAAPEADTLAQLRRRVA